MLIAISVSTNFSDILEITLKQNLKFFDHWYIITEKNDIKTINLIQNIDKITILYFDFKSNKTPFNKGGAIKYAQNIIYEKYIKCKILILDSDIYLPYNFPEIINNESFKINTLYGSLVRLDFCKLTDLYKRQNFTIYENSSKFCGYFHLYYFDKTLPDCNKYYYIHSYDCGACDDIFRDSFSELKTLEIIIYHLGHPNIHWWGRSEIKDFIIDSKIY